MSQYKSPLVSCLTCKKQLSFKGLHTHFLSTHAVTKISNKGKKINQSNTWKTEEANSKRKEYNLNPILCIICNKPHLYKARNCKFCSQSCAAIHQNAQRKLNGYVNLVTESFREKMSTIVKSRQLPYTKISQCVICSKFFSGTIKTCSSECLRDLRSRVGRKASSSRVLRSKDEIALYELCKSHYSKITHNDPIANGWDADILIHDTKTAVLWNGPWHYKEMGISNHSLKQVQNRDALKLKEFKAIGWKVVIFEDRQYTPQSAFDWLKMSDLNCAYSV